MRISPQYLAGVIDSDGSISINKKDWLIEDKIYNRVKKLNRRGGKQRKY